MKKSIRLIILFFIILNISLFYYNVYGTDFEANKGDSNIRGWASSKIFPIIRNMETPSGTLGVNSNIQSDFSDTSNNKIDCHMAKATELGALELLGLSIYNQKPSSDYSYQFSTSPWANITTGNEYITASSLVLDSSSTSGAVNDTNYGNLYKAYLASGTKYVNVYFKDNFTPISGDLTDLTTIRNNLNSIGNFNGFRYQIYYTKSYGLSYASHGKGSYNYTSDLAVIVNGDGIK